ncbi:MAG TPA: glycosyltransferase family 39 protein [Solirubrobacteraceae bacterium]|nr:glycosyltransferase family 39 protein [Solirubrobacteraceae bacterium]
MDTRPTDSDSVAGADTSTGHRWIRAEKLALPVILLTALALRLWGIRHGLPYAFNVDEGAHFVPRAIGMFGHSLNPQYFVNPPAFTYLLHFAFWTRWGTREAVGGAFAADPSTAFTIARVLAALLGAAAVGLLAWAGARLFDRRVGLVAAALLAVAFLPVHYSHIAVNDMPALAPLCLSLVGAAGVYRGGRLRDYALAGAALGVACATKYTAGIVLLCLLGASASAPNRLKGLSLAGALAVVAFVVANPYALFDLQLFREGLELQSQASSDGGGKLGLADESGVLYYLGTLTWGLGVVPALAAAGGAVWLSIRDRGRALVLVPAPLLLLLFLGIQDRFFARWILPVYPLLCLLAAWAAIEALRRTPAPALIAGALLCAQGLVFSIHNDLVLSRPDTRALARAWMVENIPEATKVVIEPIAPDAWAMDVGHPSRRTTTGHRWEKWRTSNFRGRRVKLEDYERTLSPAMLDRYARDGYCIVVTGSIQKGRAFTDPDEVPKAVAYYRELERRSTVLYRISPLRGGRPVGDFSFDSSYNSYPLSYARPGPEIEVRRLC